jgi:hypothetical protein
MPPHKRVVWAHLTIAPRQVYRGNYLWLAARCTNRKASPVISSRIMRTIILRPGGKARYTRTRIPVWTTPGKYQVLLRCVVRRNVIAGAAAQWVTIARHRVRHCKMR